MAVSSTNTSGATSIDVASIVEQLMKAESKPLDTLTSKIEQQKLIISDLGTIKSKVAILQDALKEFENPLSYNTVAVSSSNAKVLTASGFNGALQGNYSVEVATVATADSFNINGYSSTSDPVYVNDFTLSVGGDEFKWSPSGTATLNSLVSWVNSLDSDVYARVVQTTTVSDSDSSLQYSLQIFGTKTGRANMVSFSGLYTDVEKNIAVDITDVNIHIIESEDAEFTVNGVVFQRSNNTINGVIDGVTLNLISPSATGEKELISVTRGPDNSEAIIKKMIDAYNDLVAKYKEMTANSMNSEKPGTFANNPTILSFINEIKAKFAIGASYGAEMDKVVSLGTMGIDIQRDGTIKFNALNFFDAQADGLHNKLSEGVKVGYIGSLNNLTKFLDDLIGKTGNSGTLASLLTSENSQITDLNKRKLDLQDRLAGVQNSLISQYSALNALLYQLSQTNNALTSALDAITNNSKN